MSEMAGKAVTVNGLIDPDDLGPTLMHEHFFWDISWWNTPSSDPTPEEMELWHAKLSLENLYLARDRKHIRDNYVMEDEPLAIAEALRFKDVGGGTIVDVTNIGCGRNPQAVKRVADATGLNVVMGSGWYQKANHPPDMDQRTPEDLADEIIRDITVGVGDTEVRSGIIGEVGINGKPITPNEIKSLQATAWASRATGVAISLHHGGIGRERFEVAEILAKEGADPARTIFGHSGSYAGDLPFLLELLELGVYIQFDQLGRPVVPLARGLRRHGPDPNAPDTAKDVLVAEVVPKLIDAGFEDRILLSHDVCFKTFLTAYGGTGYAYLLDKFMPYLHTQGLTEDQVKKIVVENPKRVLTLAEPA
jgi:phosphotriesterase-related protein